MTYYESIMNKFTELKNKLNSLNQNLKINNQQELKCENGKYFGEVVNRLREGKEFIMFIMVIDMKGIERMIEERENV